MLEYENTAVTPCFFHECVHRILGLKNLGKRAGRGHATNASSVVTGVKRSSIIKALALL